MKKSNRGKAVVLAAAPLTVALAASAQAAPNAPIYVKGGVAWLTSSTTKNAIDDSGFTVGIGYVLPTKPLLSQNATSSVEFNYTRVSGQGNKLTSYGVSYNEKIKLAAGGGKVVPYVGFGVGINKVGTLVSTNPLGSSPGGSSPGGSEAEGDLSPSAVDESVIGGRDGASGDDWKIGAKAVAGLQFSENAFAEVSYNFMGKVSGLRTDSINLTVGVKF